MTTVPARLVVTALVSLALVGCGTTVKGIPTAASTIAGGELGGPPTAAAPATSGAGTRAPLPAEPDQTSSAPTTGATSPQASSAGSGAGAPLPGVATGGAHSPTGHGVTKSTVEIGVAVSSDANSFIGSFGLKGLAPAGDVNAQMQAIVNDVNSHGGLDGRRIVLVKHNYNAAQTLSNPSLANQSACATWTQDHHVFAVLGPPLVESTLLECLAKADTPLIFNGGGLESPLHYRGVYAKYPLFFNIGQMLGDRYDEIAIHRLYERRFFSPWNTVRGAPGLGATPMKLGIVSYDDADGAIQLASEKKQLARYGIKPTQIVKCPRDIAGKVACEQGAVLRFHSSQVTTVFNADTTFMTTANLQGYHPRYFVEVEPGTFSQNVARGILNGAMGEDYVPAMDLSPSSKPADPSPATTRCKRVIRAAHQPTDMGITLWNEELMCDEFYFLAAAVKANPVLTTSGLVTGLDSLGSYPSALTWESELSATNHATGVALRDLSYASSCNCWTYDSNRNYTQ